MRSVQKYSCLDEIHEAYNKIKYTLRVQNESQYLGLLKSISTLTIFWATIANNINAEITESEN
jgi:hypothetical protein